MKKDYLFTSESVSEGHPDKVCDRISDMVVDTYLGMEPEARVACETLTTTNKVVLAGETRGPDIKKDELISRLEIASRILVMIRRVLLIRKQQKLNVIYTLNQLI